MLLHDPVRDVHGRGRGVVAQSLWVVFDLHALVSVEDVAEAGAGS